jgi:glycosyltransferase involved in cell wall biosynthesis
MTTTPRVSVVIPTYNYGHLLEQSLESVFAQTYKDYEVILVDDGSTDDTPGIAARYEGRIRYFRKENGGPSSARNEGIRQARGPLIAFLDSDDLWLPHKLAVQTAFADAHPEYGLVYCDLQHVEHDRVIHHSYLHGRGYTCTGSGWKYVDLLREGFVFTPTVLVRKECFSAAGMHDEGLRTCQDLDMWLRIAKLYPFGFIDEPLVVRQYHGDNSTTNAERYHANHIRVFLRELESTADETARQVLRGRLSEQYFALGYHYFSTGSRRQARRCFRSVLNYGMRADAVRYYALAALPEGLLRGLCAVTGRGPYAS